MYNWTKRSDLNDYFKDKGINGKPEKEDIESLKAIAEEWEVSLKDAKIIQRVLELYPEIVASTSAMFLMMPVAAT